MKIETKKSEMVAIKLFRYIYDDDDNNDTDDYYYYYFTYLFFIIIVQEHRKVICLRQQNELTESRLECEHKRFVLGLVFNAFLNCRFHKHRLNSKNTKYKNCKLVKMICVI